MLDDDDFDDAFDEKTWLQRYGLPVGAGVFLVVASASAFVLLRGGAGPAARPHNEPHITQVQLPPPPPPPPPPKTPPPPQKQEVQKQREVAPTKAVARPAPKAPSPPAAVTTSIAGNGPGSLAVGNGGGGDCIGQGCGNGDGTGGDNDAYYSDLVKSRIQDALRHDRKLEFLKYHAVISFTLDSSGAFSHPTIASFSGDPEARAEVEQVIKADSTGDTPSASIVGKQFSIRIDSHARG
jgi:hypothetical protein